MLLWGIIGGVFLLLVVVACVVIFDLSRDRREKKEWQRRIEELSLQVKQKDDDLGQEVKRRKNTEKQLEELREIYNGLKGQYDELCERDIHPGPEQQPAARGQ